MYNYKVGNRFKWKEGHCSIEDYKKDVYELAQRENGDYYVKTIYSWYNDYADWYDGKNYKDICEKIEKKLEKIED